MYRAYLGGDVQRSIGDVQVPDHEDEAGRHDGCGGWGFGEVKGVQVSIRS